MGGLSGDSGGGVVGLEADAPMGAIAKGLVLGLPAAAQRERRPALEIELLPFRVQQSVLLARPQASSQRPSPPTQSCCENPEEAKKFHSAPLVVYHSSFLPKNLAYRPRIFIRDHVNQPTGRQERLRAC